MGNGRSCDAAVVDRPHYLRETEALIVYTRKKLSRVKEWDIYRVQTHSITEGRKVIYCHHYQIDDDVGRDLIARGLATELTTPFACRRESVS